ncbi:MAG TPA: hypothetical protein VGN72_19860 [Tepidisphaeraceae bacterium]|jgi:hypothetical protein|nr:hypothetical protein [Tepidisphaeraceae bacterium]
METGASWLADGVKEIERITRSAMIVEPKIMNLPLEKPGTYAIFTPGPAGQPINVDVRTAGPLWHNERLEDPKQLIAFITSLGERGVKPEDGAVYISQSAVTYVYNFEDRRHRATCPLIMSVPWKWLSVDQKPLSQRDLIRLLRITFDGSLPTDSNLISLIRTVKWKSDGTVESDVQRGREALGRQIIREVSGIANFPEEFTLDVQVFENVKQDVRVRVALELLPDVERFEVTPFPTQIHNGMAETLTWLQSDIAQTKVPTFIGAVRGGE